MSRYARVLACALLVAACGADSATKRSTETGRGPHSAESHIRLVAIPDGDWRTFDYDSHRGGVAPDVGITASNVGSLRVRTVHLDGVADSSPIQLHAITVAGKTRDVDVVTTTYGRTVAFDPATGAHLWEYVPKYIGRYEGSAQITTSSPVADPGRRYVYAASPNGFIHKLALTDGHQAWAARVTFDAAREKIGTALNVWGPYVIATTGGYFGDQPTYQGHVAVINRETGHVAHVWNSLCSDRHYLLHPPRSCPASDSAIWARSGAVVERGSGRLLVATGNGPFNGRTNWGNSVLELSSAATRLLHNWTPNNEAALSRSDLDVGSTAPALIPGSSLAVQGGKSGKLWLLDVSRLDGTTRGPSPRTGGQLQTISAPGSAGIFSAPVAFRSAGKTYVVVADKSATAGYVVSERRLHKVWGRPTAGTSPVVAGGLLFVYDEVAGRLRVFAPATGKPLASLAAAPGHWSSPIVIGGRAILPVGGSTADNATTGEVLIYHLPGG